MVILNQVEHLVFNQVLGASISGLKSLLLAVEANARIQDL
jgi:hypothetical protein